MAAQQIADLASRSCPRASIETPEMSDLAVMSVKSVAEMLIALLRLTSAHHMAADLRRAQHRRLAGTALCDLEAEQQCVCVAFVPVHTCRCTPTTLTKCRPCSRVVAPGRKRASRTARSDNLCHTQCEAEKRREHAIATPSSSRTRSSRNKRSTDPTTRRNWRKRSLNKVLQYFVRLERTCSFVVQRTSRPSL